MNLQRINEYAQEHALQASALVEEVINAKTYDSKIGTKSVQYFFDATNSETAPDGMGFTVNCAMHGNAFILPNLRITFGDGFTNELRIKENFGMPVYFLVRKSTHTINERGYHTDVEIVDSYIEDHGFVKGTTPVQVVQ